MYFQTIKQAIFSTSFVLMLVSCGGGGEESSNNTVTPPVQSTPTITPLSRDIITYKQAVQQLTLSNEHYHLAINEFTQKDLSNNTIEQAKVSFETFFAHQEALLEALTAYNALVSKNAKLASPKKIFKNSDQCDASTENGDILTELANASPGLIGGVNIGAVISAGNTIKTAREKIAILDTKKSNGEIDDIDYMLAMKELQKQALKDGVKTGIGGYVGAGTGLVVGMVAGAASLTAAPVVLLGAAAGYVAGTTFNMLFVNNTTQEVTTARVSAESAQFAVPDCSEGTLVISTDVLDSNDDSEPTPLIIEDFATPDTGWSARYDSEVTLTLPPAKPIEQVSADDSTLDIEKTVSAPANVTSCNDIQTIHITPIVSAIDKTAILSIKTQPEISDCLITLSGTKIIDSYHTPVSEVVRTSNNAMYFHNISGPQQGIMNVSVSVTAENGASISLNHDFDFGLISLVGITSEPTVNVELDSTLTLSELNVVAQYEDGSELLVFDTDLTWSLISGCGEIEGNKYYAPETEICTATVMLNHIDSFQQTASQTFTINIIPAFGINLIGLETDKPANENLLISFSVDVARDDYTVYLSVNGTSGYTVPEKALVSLGRNSFVEGVWMSNYLEHPDVWLNGDLLTITVKVTAPETATLDKLDISKTFEANLLPGEESPFAGNYLGAISGDDSGALSFTVDIAGYIEGTVYSSVDEQNYAIDGYVAYQTGAVSLGASGVSGWGIGTIVNERVTNGTWTSTDEGVTESGSWTVTKQ